MMTARPSVATTHRTKFALAIQNRRLRPPIFFVRASDLHTEKAEFFSVFLRVLCVEGLFSGPSKPASPPAIPCGSRQNRLTLRP